MRRLGLSVRQVEAARKGLRSKGLIKDIWLGKGLLLAPMPQLYFLLGMDCPYPANRWSIHAFLVLVAEKLIADSNPLVKYTRREVTIDDTNRRVDIVAYLKDGHRWAYEVVHRSITNVASLAGGLQGKRYAQVWFIATEHSVRDRVISSIRSAGFGDFRYTIRYTIFSSLFRQKKRMKLREL